MSSYKVLSDDRNDTLTVDVETAYNWFGGVSNMDDHFGGLFTKGWDNLTAEDILDVESIVDFMLVCSLPEDKNGTKKELLDNLQISFDPKTTEATLAQRRLDPDYTGCYTDEDGKWTEPTNCCSM